MRRPVMTGGARRHRSFGSSLAGRFAWEGEPERRASPGYHVVQHEVAAHATHQRARHVQTQAAAVAAGATGRTAFEPTEQPGAILLLEPATAVRHGRPQDPGGHVGADLDGDGALSVFHAV